MNLRKTDSATLDILRLIMCLAVICLHAYTLDDKYDFLLEMPIYMHTTYVTAVQYGRLGVPAFFVVSGFLFFYRYAPTLECYRHKLQSRIRTLLVPYIVWTLMLLAAIYVLETIPAIRAMFNTGKILVHDFTVKDFLQAFWANPKNGYPFVLQFWYLRNLMVVAICSPLVYAVIKYMRIYAVIALCAAWFMGLTFSDTLFFFSLGAWFSINGVNIVEWTRRHCRMIMGFFAVTFVADNILLGNGIIGESVHNAMLISGVPAAMNVVAYLVENGKLRDMKFLVSATFFIYAAHYPLMRFVRLLTIKLLDRSSDVQMTTAYFLAIAVDLLIVVTAYWVMRRVAPRVLQIITGGRTIPS